MLSISSTTVVVVLFLQAASSSRVDRPLPADTTRDIITLRDERAQLESRADALETQLEEAQTTLRARTIRDQAEAAFLQAKPDDADYNARKEKFDFYERSGSWNDTNTRESLNDIIRKVLVDRSETDERLRRNEREMYRATLIEAARQRFMNIVSGIFSVLMLVIIGGFFAMVWRDPLVRQSVFRGPSGLQMITLLSVVIAIILFGITGILEGKELSALLGGLSGYILGRVSDGNRDQ